jgi:hypothetical protein
MLVDIGQFQRSDQLCEPLCSKSTDQYGMQEELSSDSLKRSLLDESDFFEMREE